MASEEQREQVGGEDNARALGYIGEHWTMRFDTTRHSNPLNCRNNYEGENNMASSPPHWAHCQWRMWA